MMVWFMNYGWYSYIKIATSDFVIGSSPLKFHQSQMNTGDSEKEKKEFLLVKKNEIVLPDKIT
jgi:hypothetical protein